MLFTFFFLFSCNSKPCSGCSALHGVNPNLKKKKRFKKVISLMQAPPLVHLNYEMEFIVRYVFIHYIHTPRIPENPLVTRLITYLTNQDLSVSFTPFIVLSSQEGVCRFFFSSWFQNCCLLSHFLLIYYERIFVIV